MCGHLAEGVFEAKVEEDTFLSRAGANADWHGDARHDLESVLEVVSPSDARTEKKRIRSVHVMRGNHSLCA